MNKTFFVIIALAVLGAGCARQQPSVDPSLKRSAEEPTKNGVALVTLAKPLNGTPVSLTDADTGRMMTTMMPTSFTDGRGKYTTATPGEQVNIQLGVGGTPEQDTQLFKKITTLEQFEEGTFQTWHIVAAHDKGASRWVVRATQKDPYAPDQAYSVIECLGATHSTNYFWDGCRTMIEQADIGQRTVPPPTK